MMIQEYIEEVARRYALGNPNREDLTLKSGRRSHGRQLFTIH